MGPEDVGPLMFSSNLRRTLILAVFPLLGLLRAQSPQEIEFFETEIRPLLVANCRVCHGPNQQMAGLNLSSAAGFRRGADSGPVVVKGDPDNSRLIKAVGYRGRIKMPPAGKLAEGGIAALREWVRRGAPWPDSETGAPIRAVCEAAGITDILTKSYGTNNPITVVKATIVALEELQTQQDVELLRGVSLT